MYVWRKPDHKAGDRVQWVVKRRGEERLKEATIIGYVPSDEKITDVIPELKGKKLNGVRMIGTTDRYALLVDRLDGEPVKPYYTTTPSRTIDRQMQGGGHLVGDKETRRSRRVA